MILSRYLPPSRRPTGCPVTFPKMSHRAMSTPLIAWVIAPPAALPEGVLVQLLRDALRLEGVLAQVQRLQHLEGGTHQRLAREDAAVADGSLVGVNGHQGVNDIVGFQLLAPAALWGRSLEADGAYLPYPHARVRPSLRRSSPGNGHLPDLRARATRDGWCIRINIRLRITQTPPTHVTTNLSTIP